MESKWETNENIDAFVEKIGTLIDKVYGKNTFGVKDWENYILTFEDEKGKVIRIDERGKFNTVILKYLVEDISDIDKPIIIGTFGDIQSVDEFITKSDKVCRCFDVETNHRKMDDSALMFYDEEKDLYGEDFSHEDCVEDIHRIYGIDVANWVDRIAG